MIKRQIIKRNFFVLFLLITFHLPTLAISQTSAVPSVEVVQHQNIIDIEITLPKNIYLSDETLDVTVLGKEASLESIYYQDSEEFENRNVYWGSAKVKAIVTGKVGTSFNIVVDYQSCSKKHECSEILSYEKTFKVLAPLKQEESSNSIEDENSSKNEPEEISEQDSIAKMLKDKSLVITLLTFFGFGILLAFTPCMLPVIPILSAIIVSKKENMNAKRGFFLSLAYVISMSLVYAIAGVVAATLGSNIQAFFQQTWIIILFSLFFFILSLAMFGTFNIEMPKRIQSMIALKSASTERRTYLSVTFLGAISALIVGPCVAPPLAGALIYISQTGNEVIGGLSLFIMSLGMGIPLLLLGAGAGRFLPKPGQWMETVKLIFGFVMLAFSVWILSRIVDASTTMFLWGVLLLCLAVFMDLFEAMSVTEHYLHYQAKKIFSLLCLIFGVVLIVGALGGATNIKDPLAPYTSKTVDSDATSGFNFRIILAEEMSGVINRSAKPIMFVFTADWCDICKELEKDIFAKDELAKYVSDFDLYKIDITANTAKDRALLRSYGLFGPPGMIFFDKDKKELSSYRTVGYMDREIFIKHMNKVKKKMQE